MENYKNKMLAKDSTGKLSLILVLLGVISCALDVEKLVKRLNDPNDDLADFEQQAYSALDELATVQVKRGEGLDNAIAEFFIHDFSEEIPSSDLKEEVTRYLENTESLLALTAEEQERVLQGLSRIYERHCAYRMLVLGESQHPEVMSVVVSLLGVRIEQEVANYKWDDLQTRITQLVESLMGILRFKSTAGYVQYLTQVMISAVDNFLKLPEEELKEQSEKLLTTLNLVMPVYLNHLSQNKFPQLEDKVTCLIHYNWLNNLMEVVNEQKLNGMTQGKNYMISQVLSFLLKSLEKVIPEDHFRCVVHYLFEKMILIPPVSLKTKTTKTTMEQLSINSSMCYKQLLQELYSQNKGFLSFGQTSDYKEVSEKLRNRYEEVQMMDLVLRVEWSYNTKDFYFFLIEKLPVVLNMNTKMSLV